MLDHEKAEKTLTILKEKAAKFYEHLLKQHPKQFPIEEENLTYWKSQLEKEFPNENTIYTFSKLDAFTFYAGIKYLAWCRELDEDEKNTPQEIILAADLKNYDALRALLLEPQLLNNNDADNDDTAKNDLIKARIFNAKKMSECYQGPVGDIFLCGIIFNHPNDDIKQQHARTVLESLNNIKAFQHDWDHTNMYEAFKMYDPDLSLSFTQLTKNLDGLVKTYTQVLLFDNENRKTSEEQASSPGRTFGSRLN